MMYHQYLSLLPIFFLLFISCNPVTCQSHNVEIAPGITYYKLMYEGQPVHHLIVNPNNATIGIGVANDQCASAEKTSDIAFREGAIAAVNANFFDVGTTNVFRKFFMRFCELIGYTVYNAYPVYGCKKDGQWYSLSPVETGAVGWDRADSVAFGTISNTINFTINETPYPVEAFNKPHTGPAIYTPAYGEKTPRNYIKHVEIVVVNNRVAHIQINRGGTPIPSNGYIYTIPHKEGLYYLDAIEHTMSASLTIGSEQQHNHRDTTWRAKRNIIGSTPLLVNNGEIVPYVLERKSQFYIKKHFRSAVGIRNDGCWVFVVVGGNKRRDGFTLPELAEYMQKLQCTHALNLCGGRSATMVVRDTPVNVTKKNERAVSTALLIVPKSTL